VEYLKETIRILELKNKFERSNYEFSEEFAIDYEQLCV
jgi:hypothetical protein